MRIYSDKTVLEEAKNRISYLFDEFDDIVVSFSWWKDSTVVFYLTYEEAKKRNRLPLKVMFLDQEAEWTQTIEYIRAIHDLPGVEMIRVQVPFKVFNGTSYDDQWLECWKEWDEWLRDKEPNSIKENVFGTDRFHDLFNGIARYIFGDNKWCFVWWVRAEESPTRFLWLTGALTYKDITRGKVLNEKYNQYTFYPIYDRSYTDIWKYINENWYKYNEIYDYQYRYWIPVLEMRVSNLHHETAVRCLEYLPEVDIQLYNKLSSRLSGISTRAKHHFWAPDTLPFMFKDWKEYRDYLLEKLITNQEHQTKFKKMFANIDKKLEWVKQSDKIGIYKTEINCMLVNDYHMTKLNTTVINLWKKLNRKK